MREWLRGRWARKGVTLDEFTAMCDRGEIEGFESLASAAGALADGSDAGDDFEFDDVDDDE